MVPNPSSSSRTVRAHGPQPAPCRFSSRHLPAHHRSAGVSFAPIEIDNSGLFSGTFAANFEGTLNAIRSNIFDRNNSSRLNVDLASLGPCGDFDDMAGNARNGTFFCVYAKLNRMYGFVPPADMPVTAPLDFPGEDEASPRVAALSPPPPATAPNFSAHQQTPGFGPRG
jgi:hypothetical protein